MPTPAPHPVTFRISLVVPLVAVEPYETVLERFTDAVSWFLEDPEADETDDKTLWRLEGIARQPVERPALIAALAATALLLGGTAPDPRFEEIAPTDWVAANLKDFPPIMVGRFFVHGSHYGGALPPGRIGLMIDAGTAFGSGEHATTMGCLLALDRLLRKKTIVRALDVGCGSGILALAAAKATRRPVLAFDIDPVSVRVAARNARRNQAARLVRTALSDGYRNPLAAKCGPFDLIFANILARPLAGMAHDLGRHLAPGGTAILSGLLERQERYVLAAHRAQGLSLAGRISINGWSTLMIRRGTAGNAAQRGS